MGLSLAVLFGAFVLYLVGVVLTLWLVKRVWKQRKGVGVLIKVLTGLLIAAVTSGTAGAVLGILKGYGEVGGERIDPAQKARILAEGISEAMNCTAFALLVWLPSFIVVFMLMRRAQKKEQVPS